ncbi:MAG: hypothetical protein SOZ58_12830 [Prevotella sp.]|nr:hypothetical protein [Prevotella sp.]
MKTKTKSMKRAFILFWYGLTALLVGIANWFTVVLGMRDDSKYGKILRRTVGSCFAFLMLLMAFLISPEQRAMCFTTTAALSTMTDVIVSDCWTP